MCNTVNFSDNIDDIIDENTRRTEFTWKIDYVSWDTSFYGLVYIAANSRSFLLSQRAALTNGASSSDLQCNIMPH